ncbi:uncharacterized conserved protein [Hahella chejuensis KCTC 2396]|uniref:Uncharacterized conserved protein n=1 Tax=Hahella chejuensis (strain KCTC 2396) TaxID=349521 RepID=Q2SNR2_HAHCH|nr:uncharacterized conserved protein [Hahella chejuensis KCTC 2396]
MMWIMGAGVVKEAALNYLIIVVALAVLAGVTYYGYQQYRKAVRNRRVRFIDNYRFPPTIDRRIARKYPHLTPAQVEKVLTGLREYFHICRMANGRMVSMPSQVVDVAWHEFILFTRRYEKFCDEAFGRFLHHTPAEGMGKPANIQDGVKLAWRLSCLRENIDPLRPRALPILFALDAELKIPDGFYYSLDCTGRNDHCASNIGCSGSSSSCSSDCAGDWGGSSSSRRYNDNDSDSGSSCGSSCGGGCGGGD